MYAPEKKNIGQVYLYLIFFCVYMYVLSPSHINNLRLKPSQIRLLNEPNTHTEGCT